MPLTQEQLEANRKRLLAQKNAAKEKTPGELLGDKQYQDALQSGKMFTQQRGTGQAIATPEGLKKIDNSNKGLQPGDTRTAPGFISTEEIPTTSYEEIGAIQQEKDYQSTKAAMEALGLGEEMPSTYEQFIKAQVESKKAKDLSDKLALEGQRKDLQQAGGAIQAQGEAQQALSGSSVSGPKTNVALSGGYQSAAKAQLDRLKIDESQLAIYDEQLKKAQLAGDMELVQSIQAEKDAYINQAMQNEAQYVTALGEFERNKAAITQAGIASFQSLVESGVELDYNTVAGLASQYGLPTDTLMGYYQGAQNIRNDKTLDLAGKELALAQLNQDLNDQMNGLTTEAAKKIDYMNKQTQQWVEMGYTNEEVTQLRSNMRTMLGIEDQSDPAYQAEIAYKAAQTAYAQSNTAVNYQDMLIKEYEYNSSMGYTGGAYVPNSTRGGLYQVSATTSDDGSTSIEILNKDGEPIKVGDYGGQCGKFVNDLFGADVFTDLIGEKLAKVDPSITMPAPGMAMVWRTQGESAPYGHVVYVTGVDAENQVVNYVDSNGDGAGEKIGTGTITFQELGNLISSGDGGLVVNPNSTQQGSVNADSITPSQVAQFNEFFASGGKTIPPAYAGNEEAFAKQADQFKAMTTDPSLGLSDVLGYSVGRKELTSTAVEALGKNILTSQQLDDLTTSLEDLDEKDFGPLLGIISGNNPYNEKAQLIKAQLQSIVPNLARGVYGEVGVLTDADIANYMKTIPNLTSTEELRNAVLDMTKKVIGRSLESKLRTYAGTYDVSGYQFIVDEFGLDPQVDLASEEDPNVQLQTEYQSYSTYNDPDFLEAQSIYEGEAGSFASVLGEKTTRQRRY